MNVKHVDLWLAEVSRLRQLVSLFKSELEKLEYYARQKLRHVFHQDLHAHHNVDHNYSVRYYEAKAGLERGRATLKAAQQRANRLDRKIVRLAKAGTTRTKTSILAAPVGPSWYVLDDRLKYPATYPATTTGCYLSEPTVWEPVKKMERAVNYYRPNLAKQVKQVKKVKKHG